MANQLAHDIVQTALALRTSHPDAPALDVIDLAMKGRSGTDPVFDGDDETARTRLLNLSPEQLRAAFIAADLTHPEGAFGKLLTEAFLPPGRVLDVTTREWDDDVLLPFARRYNLWSKRANLPEQTWRTRCFNALWGPRQPSHQDLPAPALVDEQDLDEVEGENEGDIDGQYVADEEHMFEGLAMLALEIYESPASDGLTPEEAARAWQKLHGLPSEQLHPV